VIDAVSIEPQPIMQLPKAPPRPACHDLIQHINHRPISLHARCRSSVPGVRESLTKVQALAMDTPCSFTRISAACRFTDGTTVFGSERP
jgi:hypothetical protein